MFSLSKREDVFKKKGYHGYPPMSADGLSAAADLDEDQGVAGDDDDAGHQHSDGEQHLLGRLAILFEDGAGEGVLIQPQAAPHLQQRRQHHRKTVQQRVTRLNTCVANTPKRDPTGRVNTKKAGDLIQPDGGAII